MLRDFILPFAFGDGAMADLGHEVLEVGSGPGLTTDLLSDEVAHVTALELDPVLAEALACRYDGSSRVEVMVGDATSMPFEAERFSGAVSFTMLHHVPTQSMQDRLLAEVHRVLRPGGLFVASDSIASDDLAALHVDDVYNPIDPTTLEQRLAVAGFGAIAVRTNEFGFAARAKRIA